MIPLEKFTIHSSSSPERVREKLFSQKVSARIVIKLTCWLLVIGHLFIVIVCLATNKLPVNNYK